MIQKMNSVFNQEEMDEDQRKLKKNMNFPETWLQDHTWLCFEKETMFCTFCRKSKKTTPLHRQKDVQNMRVDIGLLYECKKECQIQINLSVPPKIKMSPKMFPKGTNYPPVIESYLKP